MLLIGKPSISIRAIYTMAMLVITRGYHFFWRFYMILEGFEVSWNVKVYADLLMECE